MSYMQESNKLIFQAMKAAANIIAIIDNVGVCSLPFSSSHSNWFHGCIHGLEYSI